MRMCRRLALYCAKKGMALPVFSASSALSGDATKGYIVLKASGTLTLDAGTYDIFVVGGGCGSGSGRAGGGSGKTTTKKALVIDAGDYAVTVASGSGAYATQAGTSKIIIGSTTVSANGGYMANGGSGGGAGGEDDSDDDLDGRGGKGGENGADGSASQWGNGNTLSLGGDGQGSTTRAFGESSNTLYAGGGGGCGSSAGSGGAGGAGGGGAGSTTNKTAGTAGTANTGGGGGGSGANKSANVSGGSGLVIVRWGY